MNIWLALSLSLHPLPPVKPQGYLIQPHLDAALEWIKRAHAAIGSNGISKGYDILRDQWSPAYPETTGYTIPTLLNAASLLNRTELAGLAQRLADYLLQQITPEGGVAHWQESSLAKPIVFDTGQVIFGWLAAFRSTGDPKYLSAAQRAGNWLASIQDPSGAWVNFQHKGVVKTIDSRVAWALLELYQCAPENRYLAAARNNLHWVCQQQEANGWFNHCSFAPNQEPFTHTLAYTAEGLLECGLQLGEKRYVDAARKTIDALLACQKKDGSLPGTFARSWKPTARYSCLTGNCQFALLWLRVFNLTKEDAFLEAAEKSVCFTSRTQFIPPEPVFHPDLPGGIPGSSPIYGAYERFKVPNWAVKYFVDALIQLTQFRSDAFLHCYPG